MYGEKNKSFILIKPDGLVKNIIDYIYEQLNIHQLQIDYEEKIILNIIDIQNIWTYTQSDIVSKLLMSDYLINKKCMLLNVFSNKKNAILETNIIKKNIRNRYGKHQFASVVHVPSNTIEYEKDIYILSNHSQDLLQTITLCREFTCYKSLSLTNAINYARNIKKRLYHNTYEHVNNIRMNHDNYIIVIIKNGINDSKFLAGIMSDYFNIDLCDSYYNAYAVNYCGQFPVMYAKNEKECEYIKNIFDKYGYKVDIYNE